jgi:large subunit ribosomal protein L32
MAVPKKKTSKSKTNSRKANWYNLAKNQLKKAFSIGKSILTQKSRSLYIPMKAEDSDKNE